MLLLLSIGVWETVLLMFHIAAARRICAVLCVAGVIMNILCDDAVVITSLRKRDLWPWAVRIALFCRVSIGRKRAPGAWSSTALAAARSAPWVVRVTALGCALSVLGASTMPLASCWQLSQRLLVAMLTAMREATVSAIPDKLAEALMIMPLKVRFNMTAPLTARFSKCYDGDTCTASRVLWRGVELPPIVGRDMPVRLRGIDAPEMRGRCELECCLAERAKRVLEGFVSTQSAFQLEACVRDKYFRLTCDIVDASRQSAATLMLRSGLAVPYDGRAKEHNWCHAIHAAHEHGCTTVLSMH